MVDTKKNKPNLWVLIQRRYIEKIKGADNGKLSTILQLRLKEKGEAICDPIFLWPLCNPSRRTPP
jgi:hypothetical protein